MAEDNNVGKEQLLLDYFMACFPPQAMRNIIALTDKKLHKDANCIVGTHCTCLLLMLLPMRNL
jgi:hypothetical protein